MSTELIPAGWSRKLVGEAFEICNNLRFPINEELRGGIQGKYPYYGPTKVQDYINEFRIEGKYALIGEDGDHFLKWRELPMTQLVEGKFNVNNHAHILKGNENLTEWFFFYFNHRELTPHLTRQGAGRFKLTKDALSKIPCLLPPVPEQKAIASVLSMMDSAIHKTNQLIAQKKLQKKSLMQLLLTGKTRLKGFVGNFVTVKLGDIAKISKGEQLNVSNMIFGAQYYVLNGGIEPSGCTDNWNTPENTISISEGGNSCGFVQFNVVKYWSGGHCYAIQDLKPNIYNHFLYQSLKLFEKNIMLLRVGSGLPNIQKKSLFEFSIPIPSFEEQVAIAKVLKSADEEIQILKSKVEKLKEQKKGMMQVLLTGKKRLKAIAS